MNVQPHSSAPIPSPSGARTRGETANDCGAEEVVIGRFPKSAKLLRHGDFQRVYQQGRRHFATYLTAFYLTRDVAPAERGGPTQLGPRIGFTVSRALGGAVDRNRIRRRMREAVRAELKSLTGSVDVVINPKKSAQTVDMTVLRKEVARAFAVIQEKTKSAAEERG